MQIGPTPVHNWDFPRRRVGATMRPMVNDYDRYCPISMGSDVIADRWTPLIVRELVLGNTRFNDIARGLPGISRSLLVAAPRAPRAHTASSSAGRRRPAGQRVPAHAAGRDLETRPHGAGPLVGRVALRRAATRGRRRRHPDVVDAPPRRPDAAAARAGRRPVRPHRAGPRPSGWWSTAARPRSACSTPASTPTSS